MKNKNFDTVVEVICALLEKDSAGYCTLNIKENKNFKNISKHIIIDSLRRLELCGIIIYPEEPLHHKEIATSFIIDGTNKIQFYIDDELSFREWYKNYRKQNATNIIDFPQRKVNYHRQRRWPEHVG